MTKEYVVVCADTFTRREAETWKQAKAIAEHHESQGRRAMIYRATERQVRAVKTEASP